MRPNGGLEGSASIALVVALTLTCWVAPQKPSANVIRGDDIVRLTPTLRLLPCACRKVRAEQKGSRMRGRDGKGIARGKRIQGFNSAVSGNGEMRGNAVRVSLEDNHCSPSFSGCLPLVAVVETADLRNRHNSSEFGRLHYPRFRRVLRQREMRSGAVLPKAHDGTAAVSASPGVEN